VTAATDFVSLAAGLVLTAVSAFFLLVDDPSLEDVGGFLVPLILLTAGTTLVLGTLRRGNR
jgi:fucose permease